MTEQELLTLLKKDAERGLQELITIYGSAIKTICKNILRDFPAEDIEEVMSDVLVGIWKSRENFDKRRETSFKNYCYGIARKTALKKYRECIKTGGGIPLNEDMLEDVLDLQEQFEKQEEEKILIDVLSSAEEPLRTIFILRYFYFYKVKEIAAVLKIPAKQVENYLYRGKESLKKELLKRGIDK